MSSADLINTLDQHREALTGWYANTAASIINTFRNGSVWRGKTIPAGRDLSYKQEQLVRKMIAAATREIETIALGDVGPLSRLFESSKQHLKKPKLRFRYGTLNLRLALNGERSRYPGEIAVTNNVTRRYYGRINKDGNFVPNDRFDVDTEVIEHLRTIIANPVREAVENAKITGNCCFCWTPIGEGEDERSVRVGYGPVCAKNWNLSWGSTIREGSLQALMQG